MSLRTLGLETSTTRGSVALVEGERVVVELHYDTENRHAELLLPLVERALAEASWDKRSLDRVAVSVGPGMFTGVRVGISVGLGLSLGADLDAVGVNSLRGLALSAKRARAARGEAEPARWVASRDARREEYFLAAYDRMLTQLSAPRAVPVMEFDAEATRLGNGEALLVVGQRPAHGEPSAPFEAATPSAAAIALLGASLAPGEAPLRPEYVRGPGADKIVLPPSPLDLPRS